MTEPSWVPRPQAAKLLGEGLGLGCPMSAHKLMQLVADGKLRVRTLGGKQKARYFVSRESIDAFLKDSE